MNKKRTDYTFKYNVDNGRHGWLRLTPAYSIKLVEEIITKHNPQKDCRILDPFCGTATTGIVSATNGYKCSLYDINPFLVWFGNIKAQEYSSTELDKVITTLNQDIKELSYKEGLWIPNIKNIERWWDNKTLNSLASIRYYLSNIWGEPNKNGVHNLLWIAFARLCIEVSAADFNHISLSFKNNTSTVEFDVVKDAFLKYCDSILESAKAPLIGNAIVYLGDSRLLPVEEKYDLVITSPPYPNRISYIRELRPYMYWLRFLEESKEAGELDWKAIGGTWGSATSKLLLWEPASTTLPQELLEVCEKIKNSDSKNGVSMSRYVHKFFDDLYIHLSSLRQRLNKGASINYIIGNSSFYGNMVDTESYMIDILQNLGYKDIKSSIIRKRNSKKCLYEYLISARWED